MQHISTPTSLAIHRPQSSLQVQEVSGCHIFAQEVPDLLLGGHGSRVDLQGGRGASHIQRDGERRELAISMLGDLHLEAIPEVWISVWTEERLHGTLASCLLILSNFSKVSFFLAHLFCSESVGP